ncbi:hypothetical protein [Kytococcus sedentarius]|uniref:hypothetical protein n=1 Tax=Kytococcus sedentarius TaxID=1276 RepID=UPI0035BC349B
MNRQLLLFLALAITIIYGVGFAVIDERGTYATVGAIVVALSWIAVGMLGKNRTTD